MRKGDDLLYPVPQLDVVEVMQQVAHLQLGALGHLHVQQPLLVLVFAFWRWGIGFETDRHLGSTS